MSYHPRREAAQPMDDPRPSKQGALNSRKAPGRFKCPKCSNTYTRETTLRDHLLAHNEEKPFICQFCDQAFTRKGDKVVHERTHTKSNTCKCEDWHGLYEDEETRLKFRGCGASFSRKTSLLRHRIGKDHPLICDDWAEEPFLIFRGCGDVFDTAGGLLTHRTNGHHEKESSLQTRVTRGSQQQWDEVHSSTLHVFEASLEENHLMQRQQDMDPEARDRRRRKTDEMLRSEIQAMAPEIPEEVRQRVVAQERERKAALKRAE